MRPLIAALLILVSAGPAYAQRGGRPAGTPTVTRPAEPAAQRSPADEFSRAEASRAELRRAAARLATRGYDAADVLDSYERDAAGRWFKRGEILIVATSPIDPALAQLGLGPPSRRTRLDASGLDVVVIDAPHGETLETLAALRAALPGAAIDLNYVYVVQGGPPTAAVSPSSTSNHIPRATVGMIDGAVATQSSERIAFTTRRFVSGASITNGHAAAVAAILARATAAAELRVIAADVVSAGPMEGALAEDIARALDWTAQEGAGVINVSLTGPPSLTLTVVAGALSTRGHIIVAAAGNDGPNAAPPFPAALSSVIAVTAVDARQRIWRRATRGPYVDFAALGVDVGTERLSGTSYAAPVVAGVLARMLPAPDITRAAEARTRLAASARDLGAPGPDPVFGIGLIEAE